MIFDCLRERAKSSSMELQTVSSESKVGAEPERLVRYERRLASAFRASILKGEGLSSH